MVFLKRLLLIKTRLSTIQTLVWTGREGNSEIPSNKREIYGCKSVKQNCQKGAIEQKINEKFIPEYDP